MPIPVEPRFYVDESLLGLGLTLARARRDVLHPGHHGIPEIQVKARDEDWMPLVAARGLTAIIRDKRIRSRPAEVAAYRESRLRSFWIAGKQDMSTWDNLCLLVRRWEEIEDIVKNRGDGPWFMAVSRSGIKEMSLPG